MADVPIAQMKLLLKNQTMIKWQWPNHHASAELMRKSPQLMKQNFSIWSKWTRQDGLWKDVKSMKLIFDKLIALVETQKERLQKKSQKVLRSKSSAEVSSTLKWAPAMNDEQARRLISARAVMDYEFEKQINASSSKWQMVALKYNKKFKSNQLNFVKTLQLRIWSEYQLNFVK